MKADHKIMLSMINHNLKNKYDPETLSLKFLLDAIVKMLHANVSDA